MYRKVFTPTESDNLIPFTVPKEWYGQDVEIIVFPLTTQIENKRRNIGILEGKLSFSETNDGKITVEEFLGL